MRSAKTLFTLGFSADWSESPLSAMKLAELADACSLDSKRSVRVVLGVRCMHI